MSYFPDMGTNTMIGTGDHIRAVGWLSAEHALTQGEVPAEFLARLKEFAARWDASTTALGWPVAMEMHCCELCDDFMAAGNFGVPGGGLLFVAPEMLPHYVEAHRYRPPDEFIAAVIQSPLPGSDEYWAAAEQFRRLHEQLQERLQAEVALAVLLQSRIEGHLESERRRICAEIRDYPTPITACDAQFNHLLEQRASISQELALLREASQRSDGSGGSLELLSQFAQSSRHLDEITRQCILASLHERFSERQP
jgi:hypothetical protein